MNAGRRDQSTGLVALLALFGAAALVSLTFPPRARMYPLFVGVLGALLAASELWAARRRSVGKTTGTRSLAGGRDAAHGASGGPKESGPGGVAHGFRGIRPYLAWLAGYLMLIGVTGFVLASGFFVTAFLRREGRVAGSWAVLAGVAVCAFLVFVGQLLGLHWPPSLFDPLQTMGIL